MRSTYQAVGDRNAICDRCGFKFKLSALSPEWTGLKVCARCADIEPARHRYVPEFERPRAVDGRPEPEDSFLVGTITADDL